MPEPPNSQSAYELALAEFLKLVGLEFKDLTHFSKRELKYYSILKTRPYFRPFLQEYETKLKHVKGKHTETILEALRSITPKYSLDENQTKGFLSRFRRS